MLRATLCAALLLGAMAAVPSAGGAAPVVPEARPGFSGIVPVQGWREHCQRMRARIADLEARLGYAPPWERGRIERRLWERRREWQRSCRH